MNYSLQWYLYILHRLLYNTSYLIISINTFLDKYYLCISLLWVTENITEKINRRGPILYCPCIKLLYAYGILSRGTIVLHLNEGTAYLFFHAYIIIYVMCLLYIIIYIYITTIYFHGYYCTSIIYV